MLFFVRNFTCLFFWQRVIDGGVQEKMQVKRQMVEVSYPFSLPLLKEQKPFV